MKSFTLAQELVNDTNSKVDIPGESNVHRSYAYIRLHSLHNPPDLIYYHQLERSGGYSIRSISTIVSKNVAQLKIIT